MPISVCKINAIKLRLRAEPDRWFTDHAFGGSTSRPFLGSMLAHVRAEDTILVAHAPT